MPTRKQHRDAALVEHRRRHCSSPWQTSWFAAWNNASPSCKMMTYNLTEPEGVASLLKVKAAGPY